jgi:hypothetical protein
LNDLEVDGHFPPDIDHVEDVRRSILSMVPAAIDPNNRGSYNMQRILNKEWWLVFEPEPETDLNLTELIFSFSRSNQFNR